jgi:regulation of enolase protein 1 (concanavalin A-like superfamily)
MAPPPSRTVPRRSPRHDVAPARCTRPRPLLLAMTALLFLLASPVAALEALASGTTSTTVRHSGTELTGRDIGAPRLAGSTSTTATAATVRASGADIGGSSDAFHFAALPLSGDGTITARVASLQHTHAWAKAGLMVRSGTTANAPHAFIATTPRNGTQLLHRSTPGGPTTAVGGPAASWLRLQRSGDLLTASTSANGSSWARLGSVTIPMGGGVHIGLAVTSRTDKSLTTAVFDNLVLESVTTVAPPPPSPVLWSTTFAGDDPRGALKIEVEDAPANLSFPKVPHALDGSVYRATAVAGQRNGHKWRSRFHDAPGAKGVHLGIGEQQEAHLSYRVWVPSTSSIDAVDMKLPGLAGLQPHEGGWRTATGGDQRTDSWSLRVHTRHPRSSYHGVARPERFLEAYLYAQSAGGKRIGDHTWGMSFPLTTTTASTAASLPFPLDRWNTIEMRVKMHTPGRSDGIVELWLNGVKGVSLTDVRFTLSDDVGINQLIAETFYNDPGAARTHGIDLARMAISRSYLGVRE